MAARAAWDDYATRGVELELDGFVRTGADEITYGRRWTRDYVRAGDHVTIQLEREID